MNNTAKLGMLLPTVLNPATAVVGIGLGLIWLLRHDQDEATVEDVPIKPIKSEAKTAAQPLVTVGNLPAEVERVVANAAADAVSLSDQTDSIRSAMSHSENAVLKPELRKKLNGRMRQGNLVLSR